MMARGDASRNCAIAALLSLELDVVPYDFDAPVEYYDLPVGNTFTRRYNHSCV